MLLPYALIVIVMALFLRPYLKRSSMDVGNVDTHSYRLGRDVQNLCIVLAYLIYISFAVFRKIDQGIGGTDAFWYMTYFQEGNMPYLQYLKTHNFEYGFNTIVWLIRQFTSDYRYVLFFWHTLTFILTISLLKHLKLNKFAFLSLCILLFELFSQFNTLRQTVSVTLGYIVLIALYRKKKWIALLIILLAVLIHFSALILLPVWGIVLLMEKAKARFPIKRLVAFIILSLVVTGLLLGLLRQIIMSSSKYSVYASSTGHSIPYGSLIIVTVVGVISVIRYKDMVRINPFNKVLIWALPVFYLCILLQFSFPIMYRTIMFFIYIPFALIPSLVEIYAFHNSLSSNVKMNSGYSKYIVFSAIFVCIFYRIYSIFTEEIVNVGLPYILKIF